MSQVLPILVGGGALAVALGNKREPGGETADSSRVSPPPVPSSPIAHLRKKYGVTAVHVGGDGVRDGQLVTDRLSQANGDIPRELSDRAKERMMEEYNRLADKAKTEVCKEMKRQFPQDQAIQQLDCSVPLDFESLAAAGGAAVGYAGGAYVCGPPCGALGSALGAYLGKEAGAWIEEGWDKVGDKLEEGYDEVIDWLGF